MIASQCEINDKSDSYTSNKCLPIYFNYSLMYLLFSYNQINFVLKNMTFEQKDGSHFKTMAKQM